MNRRQGWLRVILAGVMLVTGFAGRVSADVFSMPSGQKSLEFVTVGDPGNAADLIWHFKEAPGSVSYTYQMGKYDVTAAQYCQFLNAVATTDDPLGLYNPNMGDTSIAYTGCGITRSGSAGGYTYEVVVGRDNFPANYVSWGDAARFCNWLTNGQPTGVEGPGTTETGAYVLNGATSSADLMAITRCSGATYAIPTLNEWYKAAYYKAGGTDAGYWIYPTQSNDIPSNVLSATGTNNANFAGTDRVNGVTPVESFASSPGPYGTFDQGGNVAQWIEIAWSNYGRGTVGGAFPWSYEGLESVNADWRGDPVGEFSTLGFRVAAVPEPVTLSLLAMGGLLLARRRRV